MTRTERTTKTKSTTTQNLKPVTQVLFTYYKDNQFWKLIHCSAAARKKNTNSPGFIKQCAKYKKKIVSESLVILSITTP